MQTYLSAVLMFGDMREAGDTFTRGIYALLLDRKKEGRALMVSVFSQLFLAHNNLYAKVVYFGVGIVWSSSFYVFHFLKKNNPL